MIQQSDSHMEMKSEESLPKTEENFPIHVTIRVNKSARKKSGLQTTLEQGLFSFVQ